VHTLGYEQAAIAGDDLGRDGCAQCRHLEARHIPRRDPVKRSVRPRTQGAVKPTEGMRRRAPEGQQFYQTYFQMPGIAEKEFDADPKRTLRMFLYLLSGSIPKEQQMALHVWRKREALDGCVDPKQLPEWLKPEDLDYYANEY
jgi:hypothetical protein